MDQITKNNVSLYLEAVSEFEKVVFLMGHIQNKIAFDEEETTDFDIEVCEALLLNLIKNPLLASQPLNFEEIRQHTRRANLPLLLERLKSLIEGLKGDIRQYLESAAG